MSTPDFAAWWDAILTMEPAGTDRSGTDRSSTDRSGTGQPGTDRFASPPAPSAFDRLYGGHVAAQCLLAAARTAGPDRLPHSSHVTYLRGGDVLKPIEFEVRRVRDSRTLSTRLVTAEQDGRVLASATVSFQVPGEALEHETSVAAPAPDPETLPRRSDQLVEKFGDALPTGSGTAMPMDLRYIDHNLWNLPDSGILPRNRLWTRTLAPLPDEPVAHACALAYLTDFPMYEPVLFPGGMDWQRMLAGQRIYGASLDHTIWFHRPARVDDWVLLEQYSPIATGSRGLCRGEAYQLGVGLVATVVQEMAWVKAAPRQ